MEALLYQVSYIGATYYAVPVYYPGSFTFKSWYLIEYVDGRLLPYTVVSGSAVIILYNPYLHIGLTPPSPTPPSPTPTPPGTPPGTPSPPGSGVLALNGLTGNITVIGAGGIVASQAGTVLTLTGNSAPSNALTQPQADALYVRIPAPSPGVPASTPSDPLPQYLTLPEGDARYLRPSTAIPGTPGVPGTPAGTPSDPFPVYLTKVEGDGLYQPLGTPGTPSGGITQAQGDARYIQIPAPSPGVPASTPSDPLPIYLRSSEVVAPVLTTSTAIAQRQFLASPVSGVGGLTARAIELADLPVIPGVTVNQNIFKVKQSGNQSLNSNVYTALTSWIAVYNPNSIINLITGDFNPTATGLYTLTINGVVTSVAPYSTESLITLALFEDGVFLELISILPLISSTAGFIGQCVFLATAPKTYSVRVSPTKNVSVLNSGGFFTSMSLIPAY